VQRTFSSLLSLFKTRSLNRRTATEVTFTIRPYYTAFSAANHR